MHQGTGINTKSHANIRAGTIILLGDRHRVIGGKGESPGKDRIRETDHTAEISMKKANIRVPVEGGLHQETNTINGKIRQRGIVIEAMTTVTGGSGAKRGRDIVSEKIMMKIQDIEDTMIIGEGSMRTEIISLGDTDMIRMIIVDINAMSRTESMAISIQAVKI